LSVKTVVILGTGGTIAGRAASAIDSIGYQAGEVGIAELVSAIPALTEAGPILTEQVAQIDSKDMSFAIWARLAGRIAALLMDDQVQGIVITHGTDTIEETAYFLACVLDAGSIKPVVLTCAMRPATALHADGPQNVLDAVTTARTPGARGVLVVCAGRVHSAHDVQKVHTYQLDAFDSGDAGPIGQIVENKLNLRRNWPIAQQIRAQAAMKNIASIAPDAVDAWPQVEIVTSHAGASGAVVNALVAAGVRGLIVAATGNGTVHQDLEAALTLAAARGVRVLRASRCVGGGIISRPDDVWQDAGPLSPVKARIALMLELMAGQAMRV
jgi:L-asparaginase